jgi:hypothetical protein
MRLRFLQPESSERGAEKAGMRKVFEQQPSEEAKLVAAALSGFVFGFLPAFTNWCRFLKLMYTTKEVFLFGYMSVVGTRLIYSGPDKLFWRRA